MCARDAIQAAALKGSRRITTQIQIQIHFGGGYLRATAPSADFGYSAAEPPQSPPQPPQQQQRAVSCSPALPSTRFFPLSPPTLTAPPPCSRKGNTVLSPLVLLRPKPQCTDPSAVPLSHSLGAAAAARSIGGSAAAAAASRAGSAVRSWSFTQSLRGFAALPPALAPPAPAPLATASTAAAALAAPPRRQLSVQPEAAVYSGPSPRNPSRVTLRTIRKKYELGEPLTMVTAYDYPSAVHVRQEREAPCRRIALKMPIQTRPRMSYIIIVEAAGIDICLVGDSVAMVVHGHDTTLPIRLDEMLSHCQAVARGARRAFLVGDLPFGCYETDARDAVRSAVRMLKEGGMDAVKLEGGSPARVEAARAIVETGVAVMGHVGLTPQSVSVIGGFRPQAQVAEEALRVMDQAQALQRAGCFALVLECIPGPIAAAITRTVSVPTIGIGAGGECSGQVLVYHDLLGMMTHPHHAKVTPKFCKQYARVGDAIGAALQQYRREVEDRTFPGPRYSPYAISDREPGVELLAGALRKRGLEEAAEAALSIHLSGSSPPSEDNQLNSSKPIMLSAPAHYSSNNRS
ncbi:hypothetical protein VOLCADRAFT_103773 [Volvox carteri f. nagariensis]|uniref:3-methyl-2-oxobutanoate hydroxymethyltransferase n=1 Tax=Volvox carteri f. nagariensis TaxID=3068 RepID=D8TP39_VOLCA|nr:uncharacterized protein VOLCADRAFT_103773 [Volvox carteri f. nagariensis]EFJ50554.1 hypothetical protein VOLCADRAFT_103773 [Volvox carteri f. nagariensis]|eukprot:XP_002948147.1 hypothetical protein VOLCADRAFT_103773 [Volvox carteri f. nagariensis]